MPTKISWLKNTNSRKWKQLEATFPYLENEFTTPDIKNVLADKWESLRQSSRKYRSNKRFSFTGHEIAKFLIAHPKITSKGMGKDRYKIYQKTGSMRNKNVMDRKI
tara:strand:- start:6375 stop:6692 length:318 start_codon:yes stop_codon:yes gene_type:complete